MRYRIQVTRVQVLERTVRADSEATAMSKLRDELQQPYGMLGRWETVSTEAEVVSVEQAAVSTTTAVADGGLLLSVADAAKALGVSRGTLYELVKRDEIESLQIGRRRLVPRQALLDFINRNTTGQRD